jgi:hypothetical protein
MFNNTCVLPSGAHYIYLGEPVSHPDQTLYHVHECMTMYVHT